MIGKLLASAAFASLILSTIGGANAAPAFGFGLSAPHAATVEQVDYRRVCDRDGDHCRRVWVGDRDDRRWGWRKICDRDGDRCRWVRRDRD